MPADGIRFGRARGGAGACLTAVLLAAGAARGEGAAETEALRREVAQLQRQVRYLAEALARARLEADGLRVGADRERELRAAGPEAALTATEFAVRDVNRDLGLVVIAGGRYEGLRPGLGLRVVRGGRTVARARVIDVRMRMAGAVIEDRTPWTYPETGDQALVDGDRKE